MMTEAGVLAGLSHHLREHAGCGGFAVRASDHEPGAELAEHSGAVQPKAQLHVADDVDAGGCGVDKQGRIRPPPGRGDHQPDLVEASACFIAGAGIVAGSRGTGAASIIVVHDGEACAGALKQLRRPKARHPGTCDQGVVRQNRLPHRFAPFSHSP